MPFAAGDMNSIEHDKVALIDIFIAAHQGEGLPDQHLCRFRTEGVLVFADKKVIGTGYKDTEPARQIQANKNLPPFHTAIPRAEFHNSQTLTEPIG